METSSKPIVTPRTWNARAIYLDFVEKLLKANPDYWTKYSKSCRMRHFWVYTTNNNKLIEIINFDRWKDIMHAYFMSARIHIIGGEGLNMGNFVGKIFPKRVERNHKNKQVNWKATHARPKVWNEEKQKWLPDVMIYYVDDEWIRISWSKTKQLPNETVYTFIPCSGSKVSKGFQEQFSQENNKNPTLKLNYTYSAYTRLKKRQRA